MGQNSNPHGAYYGLDKSIKPANKSICINMQVLTVVNIMENIEQNKVQQVTIHGIRQKGIGGSQAGGSETAWLPRDLKRKASLAKNWEKSFTSQDLASAKALMQEQFWCDEKQQEASMPGMSKEETTRVDW